MSLKKQLFQTKSLKALLANLEEGEGGHGLHRVLGPISLTSLGVGAIIGTGIFVATGEAARNVAGPALMVSYIIAGITCVFAALCYAEFAAMAPVAGSAYTYSYATLGEIFAWIIGWDLVLEYAVGSATVANGWSSYAQKLLENTFGRPMIPKYLSESYLRFSEKGGFETTGSYINLPAVLIVAVITIILIRGIAESAGFNALMVFIKVAAVIFVILVGAFYINPENWTPFAPKGWGGLTFFGKPILGDVNPETGKPMGVLAGAAIIFFSYIGFDSVSTHAEEAKNPKRDVPIGIIGSLLICTILYIAVVAVITGMVPYDKIDPKAAVAAAFKSESVNLPVAEFIIAAAGVAGITSVLLVMMLSAPRVFMAMARDGLVPKKFFGDIHPKYKTPWKSTIAIGIFVGILAGLLPIGALLDMANIGTLFAFTMVCAAVLIMRRTNPDAPRPFRCPFVPAVPILGIICCLGLMFSLPWENWLRLVVWLLIGLVIYFCYGAWNSNVGKEMRGEVIPDSK